MLAGKRMVTALLSGMLLAACGEGDIPEEAAPDTATTPDSFAFSVEVTLSDAARERLDASGETVIVAATYFAGGRSGIARSELNEVGLIDLGRMEVEHVGEGIVAVDGASVRRDRLGLIEGEPQVNINVYSGRRTSPDNILDCDMFQDDVRLAARAQIRIACRLLAERENGQP